MTKRISRYILSSVFILCTLSTMSQGSEREPLTTKGLRIGVDASYLLVHQLLPERTGWEVTGDYQWKRNWFAATEFGAEQVHVDRSNFKYDLQGGYFKLGFDYDVLKSEFTDDIVTVGLRYGVSRYKHRAADITIENYWGPIQESIREESFNGNWVELVLGMKAELFFMKNVFIGWSIRSGIYLWGKRDNRMDAYVIPGYGSGEKNITITYNWTLSYRIPFKKDIISKPPK